MTEHFVIVGAQRSGTTRLYSLLQQHPDICMAQPMRPEPKFFLEDDAVETGYSTYLQRFFAHRQDERALGEKSTSYIERHDAIARMHAVLPNAKLVFVLRNPARRAYSNWRFSREQGLETLSFEQALEAEALRLKHDHAAAMLTSVNPFAYTARGEYTRYLDAWAEVFPREQIIIVLSERLFAGHDATRDLFGRLSLDSNIPLIDSGKVNASQSDALLPSASVSARLSSHFRDYNEQLAAQWNVDISPWQ